MDQRRFIDGLEPQCRLSAPRNCLLAEAAIAQLGERQTEDLEVPGSIPGYGIFAFSVTHYGRAACCPLSLSKRVRRMLFLLISGVAQWLACWAHNSKVGGSKPLSAR